MLTAIVLTAAINAELDLSALIRLQAAPEPKSTCNISTVGYHFAGMPKQKFRYAGDTYEIPDEGWVELIADPRRVTYSYEGRTLPLDGGPRDQFGFREVSLP